MTAEAPALAATTEPGGRTTSSLFDRFKKIGNTLIPPSTPIPSTLPIPIRTPYPLLGDDRQVGFEWFPDPKLDEATRKKTQGNVVVHDPNNTSPISYKFYTTVNGDGSERQVIHKSWVSEDGVVGYELEDKPAHRADLTSLEALLEEMRRLTPPYAAS